MNILRSLFFLPFALFYFFVELRDFAWRWTTREGYESRMQECAYSEQVAIEAEIMGLENEIREAEHAPVPERGFEAWNRRQRELEAGAIRSLEQSRRHEFQVVDFDGEVSDDCWTPAP